MSSEPMGAEDGTADNVSIPSVFIGQTDGDTLKTYFRNYHRCVGGCIVCPLVSYSSC